MNKDTKSVEQPPPSEQSQEKNPPQKRKAEVVGENPSGGKRNTDYCPQRRRSWNSSAQEGSGKTEEKEKTYRPSYQKKKIALLLAYNGTGYSGMQINPGQKTIECDLMTALWKSGAVSESNKMNPGKIHFQRTARTDKGVHAGGQVVSFKCVLIPNLVEKINEHLVPQIRCFGARRTIGGFNCKNACDARTYEYVTPTYAFAPPSETTTTYRIEAERVQTIRNVLKHFNGTHNFHNYTSGKDFSDMSANRFIMSFECSEPYIMKVETESEGKTVVEDLEVVVLKVKGQSFVLHQIRKMVGMTMAVVRGEHDLGKIAESFLAPRMALPRAPGLGLVLSRCHFEYYNKKVKKDKSVPWGPLDWENDEDTETKLKEFKDDYILKKMMETEVKEREIFEWLNCIKLHSLKPRDEEEVNSPETNKDSCSEAPEKEDSGAEVAGDSTKHG
eukprot:Nk52_evm29s2657 gene=Nk52_evmTU29s2657